MAKKNLRNWLYLIFTALFFVTQARALAAQSNSIQIDEARQKAADLLTRMTPEQKIGQIFLVTFKGTDIGPESSIFELITEYNIGGIVLSAKNNNIPADDPVAKLPQGAEVIGRAPYAMQVRVTTANPNKFTTPEALATAQTRYDFWHEEYTKAVDEMSRFERSRVVIGILILSG